MQPEIFLLISTLFFLYERSVFQCTKLTNCRAELFAGVSGVSGGVFFARIFTWTQKHTGSVIVTNHLVFCVMDQRANVSQQNRGPSKNL